MAILFAAWLTLAAALGALAIDTAVFYLDRREMQSAVDLAALAAARAPDSAYDTARDLLAEAGWLPDGASVEIDALPLAQRLVVVVGRYEARAELPPASRFVAGRAPHNAVRVTLRHRSRTYFADWFTGPVQEVTATAAVEPWVEFSIGSRAARLEGGVVNTVLNGLLGTGLGLSLLDYRALAAAQVDSLLFLEALALETGANPATYGDILRLGVTEAQVARTLARLLPAQKLRLETIALASAGRPAFPVARLLDFAAIGAVAPGTQSHGTTLDLSVLDLVAGAATLGGAHQLSLAISASLPGLAGIAADVAIGEPPLRASVALGPIDTRVETAQVRARIVTSLAGGPALLGAGITLPLYLAVAPAEARVTAASCPTAASPYGTATLSARPGLARLEIGEVALGALPRFDTPPAIEPARLADTLLLKLTGSALLEIVGTSQSLRFTSAEIAAGRIKTVATTGIVGSAVGSLLGRLTLTVRPLGLSVGGITAALTALLTPVTPVLDTVVDGLAGALGLGLGEADLRVYGVRCLPPVLVQ